MRRDLCIEPSVQGRGGILFTQGFVLYSAKAMVLPTVKYYTKKKTHEQASKPANGPDSMKAAAPYLEARCAPGPLPLPSLRAVRFCKCSVDLARKSHTLQKLHTVFSGTYVKWYNYVLSVNQHMREKEVRRHCFPHEQSVRWRTHTEHSNIFHPPFLLVDPSAPGGS